MRTILIWGGPRPYDLCIKDAVTKEDIIGVLHAEIHVDHTIPMWAVLTFRDGHKETVRVDKLGANV